MGRLKTFLDEHLEDVLNPYLAMVKQRIARYAQLDPETFPANTRRMIRVLPLAAESPDLPEVRDYVEGLVRERLPEGFELTDTLTAMFYYKDVIVPLHDAVQPDPQARLELLDELCEALRNVGVLFARTFVELQNRLLERHRQAMLELSTPVISVWEGVLALPLIGTIDTYRARQIMDELLQRVTTTRAKYVLLDITGVPVVDTNVADHLIKTVRAAELLGARCLLVGIGPELAQTIVGLGVDLRSIASCADMRQGLAMAFRRLGFQVVQTGPVSGE